MIGELKVSINWNDVSKSAEHQDEAIYFSASRFGYEFGTMNLEEAEALGNQLLELVQQVRDAMPRKEVTE